MGEPLHSGDPPTEATAEEVRFGPYVADLRAGVLRKHDIRLRLAEQPFRILARLVRSPGELVTREELIELLWPDGTHVEFERSLNAAVKKLRRALNDSPTAPNYIQTLPKKGYRFVAPVEVVGEADVEPRRARREMAEGSDDPPAVPEGPVPTFDQPRAGYSARHVVVVGLGVVFAIALIVLLREAGLKGGSSSVAAGPLRFEVRALEEFAERQWMLPSLSPDGASVAFSWNGGEGAEDPKEFDVYIQRLDGGEPVRATTAPGRDVAPSWSPDGLHIATWRQWPAPSPGTFVVSLRDGSETRVMGGGPGGASWTPDAKWLVAPADEGIVAVSTETRERREIVKSIDGAGPCSFAAVSPDGRYVAFVRCPNRGSCDLFVQFMKGGEPRQLTFEKGTFGGVAWTPDSGSIVYSVDGTIYRVAASGRGTPQPIEFINGGPLTGRMTAPTIARFAPNGSTRMIFRHSPVRDADIWETDISGEPGSVRKVVDSPGLDWRPAYSPDGLRIAFESRQEREYGLWICDRDGSNRRQLADADYRMGNMCPPAWSPDGRQIAFRASTPSDKAFHIYTVSVEGGVPRRITVGEDETAPAWSRDGLWIYFVSKRSGRDEIWKAPSNGSGPVAPVSNMLAWSFAESSDGRFVYFCGAEKQGTAYGSLFRVPVEGGDAERLLQPFSFSHLELRGEFLYFLDRALSEGRRPLIPLKRLDLRTKEITEVARIKDPGGPRLFSMSPDGRSILTTEMGPAKAEMMLVEDFR